MAFQPCPGIAEVVMHYSQFDGEFCENVFHVASGDAGPISDATLLSWAEHFTNWYTGGGAGPWSHPLLDFMASGSVLLSVTARDLTVEAGGTAENIVGVNGTNVNEPLPNGVCKAITLRSGIAGRSFRGRWYVPNLTEEGATEGDDMNKIKPDIAADLVLATNDLVNNIASTLAPAALVILSRRANHATRPEGLGVPVLHAGFPNLFMDYQRRRAPAHNRHH